MREPGSWDEITQPMGPIPRRIDSRNNFPPIARAAIAESAEPAQLSGVPIRVTSVAMLIRLKDCEIAANSESRDEHVADIELLRHRETQ
ncbi:MAG: hypothetical protein WD795_18945 [Woeseia sp.]